MIHIGHWRILSRVPCSILSGPSVHGISQARTLEWVAISSSRESSEPRDWTWVFPIAGRLFTIWATREAWKNKSLSKPESNQQYKDGHGHSSTVLFYQLTYQRVCAILQLLISYLFLYIVVCVCINLNLTIYPSEPHLNPLPLVKVSLFSSSVTLLLFCRWIHLFYIHTHTHTHTHIYILDST